MPALAMTGLAVLLVGCGWTIAAGHVKLLFISVAAAGVCALALRQRGAFIGILVLAAMNGLPFVDTSHELLSGKLTLEDVAAMVLMVAAGVWILFDDGSYRPSRTAQVISRLAVFLFLWWLWTLIRTVVGQHVSILSAAAYGKDFVFFAVLLILLPQIRLTGRDIGALLGILAAGVCLFAVGQITIATGHGFPESLVHFHYTLQESGFTGLTRVYAAMTNLVTAGLPASIAAIMLARDRTVRLIALPIALLLTTSTVVQLTRARWIGLVVGIVLVSLWLMIRGEMRVATVLRKRFALAVGVLVSVGGLVLIAAPGVLSGGTVIDRLSSLFTDLQTGGGTVAVREAVTKTMKAYLGEKWPAGLGFVPPAAHYFEGLPNGSIRDSDLGVLNAVMTMGVIGAVLIYLPVISMLIDCLRRRPLRQTGEYSWLRYGGAIWIVATLASSVTLTTLFSTSGVVLVGVAMMILVHPSVSGTLVPTTATSFKLKPKPITVVTNGLGQPHRVWG